MGVLPDMTLKQAIAAHRQRREAEAAEHTKFSVENRFPDFIRSAGSLAEARAFSLLKEKRALLWSGEGLPSAATIREFQKHLQGRSELTGPARREELAASRPRDAQDAAALAEAKLLRLGFKREEYPVAVAEMKTLAGNLYQLLRDLSPAGQALGFRLTTNWGEGRVPHVDHKYVLTWFAFGPKTGIFDHTDSRVQIQHSDFLTRVFTRGATACDGFTDNSVLLLPPDIPHVCPREPEALVPGSIFRAGMYFHWD